MLVGLDTSAGTSAAVVAGDGSVLAERRTGETLRHAELVGPFLAAVLGEAGVAPSQVTGVATGTGPGPFTGLRVGIAAARAFALGAGARVLPVLSPDGVALDVLDGDPGARVLVVADARRRERFCTAYDGLDDDGLPRRTDGPYLASPDEARREGYLVVERDVVPAGALARVARRRLAASRPEDPDAAVYLRAPDVTLASGPKRVTA